MNKYNILYSMKDKLSNLANDDLRLKMREPSNNLMYTVALFMEIEERDLFDEDAQNLMNSLFNDMDLKQFKMIQRLFSEHPKIYGYLSEIKMGLMEKIKELKTVKGVKTAYRIKSVKIYAGFWKRFAAKLLDIIILFPWIYVSMKAVQSSKYGSAYVFIPNMLINVLFNVYLVASYGGTPGKLMMNIRITREDFSPVNYYQASLRFSVAFLLTVVMGLGELLGAFSIPDAHYYGASYAEKSQMLLNASPFWGTKVRSFLILWTWSELIVMLTNRRRKSIHDYIAGTVVVNKDFATHPEN